MALFNRADFRVLLICDSGFHLAVFQLKSVSFSVMKSENPSDN